MFEYFEGKKVKVIYQDGDKITSVTGVLLGVDASKFAKVKLDTGLITVVNVGNIVRVKEQAEDG